MRIRMAFLDFLKLLFAGAEVVMSNETAHRRLSSCDRLLNYDEKSPLICYHGYFGFYVFSYM